MSNTSSTMANTPQPSSRSEKGKTKSKIVILKLSPDKLAIFAPKPPPSEPKSEPKSEISHTSTPDVVMEDAEPEVKKSTSSDNPSEANDTPAPTDAPSPAGDGPVKKRKGPAPGFRRNGASKADGLPRERGKPGPKRKPRLDDGTIDHGMPKTTLATATGNGVHKVGPRGNQGAINAGLRALDRTGKPCRKWTRKAFSVKSFTGVTWDLPSWKTPSLPAFVEGEDSEMNDASQQTSSDIKPNESSTAMESNGPDNADRSARISTPAASSPPPPQPLVASAQA